MSDEGGERFGALEVWESREASEQPLPQRIRQLLGADPLLGEELDVEATASVVAELQHRGLAFE